ncbi:MAG: aspartate ammonia-lyase, partial [Deltaproteobacteria bacterium]|nr:aspartate ammonia-lyase [Deltaproteobacteria bacterium]
MDKKYRIEKDPLGEKMIPEDAYYGVQTQRAIENFPISGLTMHPLMAEATVMIKLAAAKTNVALGGLKAEIGEAIIQAAHEALEGKITGQFVVDVYQAGAGTSHNMNVNEVLANRAIEILGKKRGDYTVVHPNDHVNMGQSTNDVFPTAMRLATLKALEGLYHAGMYLARVLKDKGEEFYPIIKAGRTHLQDAVPMRLGHEFRAYGQAVEDDFDRLRHAAKELEYLGIGATAVGAGTNTLPGYREMVIERLSTLSGFDLKSKRDLFEATQNMNVFASIAAQLKLVALNISRIANDLRLLSSGPRTGLAEIALPAVQPGSSIMAGKINPVMAEMINMVCFQVIGNETTVAMAAQAGQLELNVMMPVIIHNILASIQILQNALSIFTERCVRGITANPE